MSDMEQDMVNIQVTHFKSTDIIKKKYNHSSATRVSDGSKDTKSDSDHGGAQSATDTMNRRWQDHLSLIPQCDKEDIQNDNPNFNGGHQCFVETVH